jgi:hypothetical protein
MEPDTAFAIAVRAGSKIRCTLCIVSKMFFAAAMQASKKCTRWPELYDMTREELRAFLKEHKMVFHEVSRKDYHLLHRAGRRIKVMPTAAADNDIFDWALQHLHGANYYDAIGHRINLAVKMLDLDVIKKMIPLFSEFDRHHAIYSISNNCPTEVRRMLGLDPTPASDFLQACYEGRPASTDGIVPVIIDIGAAISISLCNWDLAMGLLQGYETRSHSFLLTLVCQRRSEDLFYYLINRYGPPNEVHLMSICKQQDHKMLNLVLPYIPHISANAFATICINANRSFVSAVLPFVKDRRPAIKAAQDMMLTDVIKFLEPHIAGSVDEEENPPTGEPAVDISAWLGDGPASLRKFPIACKKGHIRKMAALFDAADDAERAAGFNAACSHGGLLATKWLIEHGVFNVNDGIRTVCGLSNCRRSEEKAILDLLLKQGAPINRDLVAYAMDCNKPHVSQTIVAHLTAPIMARLQGVPAEEAELLMYIASIACPVCNSAGASRETTMDPYICRFSRASNFSFMDDCHDDAYISQEGNIVRNFPFMN